MPKFRYMLGACCLFVIITLIYVSASGKVISLAGAPELAGSVAQSMYSGGGQTSLPVAGKDFNLKNIKFFNDKQWAVVSVEPVNYNFDSGIVVLKKQADVYIVQVPPNSKLSSSYLVTLPKEVVNYLQANGLIYEPGQ